MNFKRKKTRVFVIAQVLILALILPLMFPLKTLAEAAPAPPPSELDWMTFQSDADSRLILGETTNIKVKLYDQYDDPYTGGVSAYISDSDSHTTYYSVNGGTVNNVTLDQEGTYNLVIYDNHGNYVGGTITVTRAAVSLSGTAAVNTKSLLSGKFTDSEGHYLPRRTLTIDASEAGLNNTINVTTTYDGTFSLSITPTQMGEIKFLYAGHPVGSIDVDPAYSYGTRIGQTTKNNTELSVAVAEAGWDVARTVILTRDDNLADSLAAVPLSKKYDAPILMTPSDKLDESILSELGYLDATEVYIIGGENAISPTISDKLSSLGYSVRRLAGANRYETATLIASDLGSSNKVYLAYGYGEPDALAASSFAALNDAPILLTDKNSLPEVTAEKIANLDPAQVVILGGNAVVSSTIENDLSKKYIVNRWGGADRYETEWAILRNEFSQQTPMYFASALASARDISDGKPFADSLLAAALAAKQNGVVVTLPPNYLPKSLEYFLLYNKGYIPRSQVIGNTKAISSTLEQKLVQLLEH